MPYNSSASSYNASDILSHPDPYEQQSSTDHIDIYTDILLNEVESSTDSIIEAFNIDGVNFNDFLNDDDEEEEEVEKDDFKFEDFLKDDEALYEGNKEVYQEENEVIVEVQEPVGLAQEEVEVQEVRVEVREEEEELPRQSRKRKSEAEELTSSSSVTPKTKRKKADKKIYSCPEPHCSLTTDRLYNFRQHMLTHEENRVKPFICEQCGKGYTRNSDLTRHMKTKGH